jgi:hypothetical protein
MSFKDTVLPDFVIASLYPGSLTGDRTEPAGLPGLTLTAPEDTQPRSLSLKPMDSPPAGELVTSEETSATVPGLPYRYLGKNLRKVSVIARYKDDPYIPEEHLQFLIKILAACKLNLGDVAIMNDAVATIQIRKLKDELNPSFVLLFDVQPAEIGLPLSFPALKPQSFDGRSFLLIPSIDTLIADTEAARGLKKQLWDSLKKMFAV